MIGIKWIPLLLVVVLVVVVLLLLSFDMSHEGSRGIAIQ
jgi:hypothetical protein